MKVNKTIAIAVLLVGLLMGGLAAGALFSQKPLDANAAPPAQQPSGDNEADEANEANEADEANEANQVNETDEANGEANEADNTEDNDANTNEADEAGDTEDIVSPDQAAISVEQAKAAAEAANPGAKAVDAELENEGGQVAYDVELDNGTEVRIDAANVHVLGTGQ